MDINGVWGDVVCRRRGGGAVDIEMFWDVWRDVGSL